jgi:acetyl esterase
MYIHGGAFHFMSRKTHWLMGLLFASQGYVVYNVEYRLAPRYRFPAAVQDVLDAYAWIVTHRSAHGAAGPIVVAGESAGANLSWSVLLASCYERSEEWARRIFDLGVVPRACVSLCGMLQVTDPERYLKDSVPRLFYDRIQEVAELYLPEGGLSASDPVRDFADPLLVLERGEQPRRPLPPVVGTVGTADPLIEDTRRLDEVLDRFDVPHRFGYYPGQIHAFQAFIWSRPARRSWQEVFTFLRDVAKIHTRPTGSAWAKRLVVEG